MVQYIVIKLLGGEIVNRDIVRPSILPGFMELTPSRQILFNKMMDTIRKNYEKFGFLPIDTPAIEKSEVLLAKGGGETEKQIYRVVKGDTKMSLRFDLTVPLARYVSQHYSELSFPFRRYHIAKVYRGERSQRGRFREFYQADIDIIGNGSLDIINDAEIPSVIYTTFKDLGFDNFTIRINNRKVLTGFFSHLGISDVQIVMRAIDRLEKVGLESVIDELRENELNEEQIKGIVEFISIDGDSDQIIERLKEMKVEDATFKLGVEELEVVVKYLELFGVPRSNYCVDLTIARGLDYYTGTVYETILNDYPSIGSVCSGGRYDDLASHYITQNLPGVGISIGLTRLFYQLEDAGVITAEGCHLSKVLVIPMDGFSSEAIELAADLRNKDISAQVYLEEAKIGKKFNYADKLGIPFTIVIGEEEKASGKYTLKDMDSGEQKLLTFEELAEVIMED
jgi:histidyl-tRNA synthetase